MSDPHDAIVCTYFWMASLATAAHRPAIAEDWEELAMGMWASDAMARRKDARHTQVAFDGS